MTPEEKAKELVEKWGSFLSDFKQSNSSRIKIFSKTAAISECDIRINQIEQFPINPNSLYQKEEIREQKQYWQSVKQEIEKL